MQAHTGSSDALFSEQQQFRQPWLWALITGIDVVVLFGMWEEYADTNAVDFAALPQNELWGLAIGLIALVGIPLLMWYTQLSVELFTDGVRIVFRPFFVRRTIALNDIAEAAVRDYRPIREYGGWGIRWRPHKGMVYSVSGNRGVQIALKNGNKILIGSRQPEALVGAIECARAVLRAP
jgi:hypothetical protein